MLEMKKCYLIIVSSKIKDFAWISLKSFMMTNPDADVLCYTDFGGYHDIDGIRYFGIESKIDFNLKNAFCNLVCYRIELLEELKNIYDSICIVDTDTLFVSNIDDIFNYRGVAGVSEMVPHNEYLKNSKIQRLVDGEYLNCGIMKFDSGILKKYNLPLEFAKKYSENPEAFTCPEQDFFNVLFHDNITIIPDEFNCLMEHGKIKGLPRVVHFVGKYNKPKNLTVERLFAVGNTVRFYQMFLDFCEHIKFENQDTYHVRAQIKKYHEIISNAFPKLSSL